MSSTDRPSAVTVTLVERSFVCPTGGGFETERWYVQINDGWMPVSTLAWRRSVGTVRVAVLDEDDPDGVAARGAWADRAPQVWFKRSTRVEAPIGTPLWRRTWRPLIDPKRFLEYPLPQRVFDDHFELRGEERMVSLRVLAQRRAEREAAQAVQAAQRPLTKDEIRGYASTLLSSLDGTATTARTATAPASVTEVHTAASAGSDVPRGRRAPVRTLSLPGEPAPVPATRRPTSEGR